MLILTRKIGERIVINDDIIITFLGKNHNWNQIKLGIEAPDYVSIVREELIKKDFESCQLQQNMKL